MMSKRGTSFYRVHIWTHPPDDPLTIMCGGGKRWVLPPVSYQFWLKHQEQTDYCTCCANAAMKIRDKLAR